jgi:hypothetical protein
MADAASVMDPIWGKLTNARPFPFFQALTDVGDGTGTHHFLGDYSSAAEDAFIQPAAGEVMNIHRLSWQVDVDQPVKKAEYGSILALTNGVSLIHECNGVETLMNPGGELTKKNGDILDFMPEYKLINYSTGDVTLYTIVFGDSFEDSILLNGATSDKLIIRLNDDFDGLTDQEFVVHGVKRQIVRTP